mgnify:CR=1 FL=1
MVKTIDMQEMRYLNLFEQVTRVRTRFSFKYNENIFFCVPKPMVSRSIGENGRNLRQMSSILNKNIRVVAAPRDIGDIEPFIRSITNPITFKGVEVKDGEVVVSGGKNKAILIGRNKRRLLEMQKIVQDFFNMGFRIA